MSCVCIVCASLLPQERNKQTKKKKQMGQMPHEEFFPISFLSTLSHAHCDFLSWYAKFILAQGPLQVFLQSEMFSSIFLRGLVLLAPSKFKHWAFQVVLVAKNLPADARDIRNRGVRSLGQEDPPGWRHSNPLQCSCLENPTDRDAWRDLVHRVPKTTAGLKWLSTHTRKFKHIALYFYL